MMIYASLARAEAAARAMSRKHGIRVYVYRGGVGGREWIAVDGSLGALPYFPGGKGRWVLVSQIVEPRNQP